MSFQSRPPHHATPIRPFTFRQLTGDDRDHIEAVFDGLSDQDRYYRFFRPMPTYPASVLELLTGMDGVGHVAVGAFDGDTCVGVARFIRSTRRPESAEVAVTVAGTHRGCGLARRMVESLNELAADRGIGEFEVLVHPSNRAAARLFRSMGFAMALEDGSVIGHRPVGMDQDSPGRRSVGELALAA